MAHPHLNLGRKSGKKRRLGIFNRDLGMAILTIVGGAHLAAQMMHDEMQSVADAKNRKPQRENSWIGIRSIRVIHRTGPAGKNDPDRGVSLNFGNRSRT